MIAGGMTVFFAPLEDYRGGDNTMMEGAGEDQGEDRGEDRNKRNRSVATGG
jgi:hypothetical protein